MNVVSPDKIVLNVDLRLKRKSQRIFNSVWEDRDADSLLKVAAESGDGVITDSDRIDSSNQYQSGFTVLYIDKATGISALVRGDYTIIKLIFNMAKLAYGTWHNGRMVKSQDRLDKAMRRVERWVARYSDDPFEYEYDLIELAVTVGAPSQLIQSFFLGKNLRRSHQTPCIYLGQSVGLNRGRRADGKRPEFGFQAYDKRREMVDTYGEDSFSCLPEHVSRLEFCLRGDRLEREFGGAGPEHVTYLCMQSVFWRLFDEQFSDLPVEVQPELCSSKSDMLARMIWLEQLCADHLPAGTESTLGWWLRSNANPKRAQNLYHKAAVRANSLLGRCLTDYVNPSTPTVEIY